MKRTARGLGCLLFFACVQFCDFEDLDSSASAETETSLASYIYAYYVGQENTQWGDSIPLDDRVAKIVPGQWHRLTQRIKLNDSDQSNGEIDVWFDDEIAYSSSSFRWREGAKGMIDAFYFSTFHGGQSSDWAPEVDSFCRFDDFLVSRERPDFITKE